MSLAVQSSKTIFRLCTSLVAILHSALQVNSFTYLYIIGQDVALNETARMHGAFSIKRESEKLADE